MTRFDLDDDFDDLEEDDDELDDEDRDDEDEDDEDDEETETWQVCRTLRFRYRRPNATAQLTSRRAIVRR